MKNCMVAQSGGPTAVINASLAGVLEEKLRRRAYGKVFGAIHGISGLLDGQVFDFGERAKDTAFIDRLKITPSMYLGSCRYKLPADPVEAEPYYKQIFETFEKDDIGAFFYIGGNDSMDTAAKLAAYAKEVGSEVRIVGIPKTIDNDLVCTDHTPGYGSAAKFVATSVLEIFHDACIYPLKSVTVVEVMGRDAGWLTAASALARTEYSDAPQLIYLPEVPFDMTDCIRKVKDLLSVRDEVVIAVSEGIRDRDGNYISAAYNNVDEFGHAKLEGVGRILENNLKAATGVKVRSVELSVLQRSAAHIASKCDIDEAAALGASALSASAEGESGVMPAVVRKSDCPYAADIELVPVAGVANAVKNVPAEFIAEGGYDVTEAFVAYARPLIEGEAALSYANGIPEFADIRHLTSKN